MNTSVIGYPRVGASRELKFESEKYFRKEISAEALFAAAAELRKTHWQTQLKKRIDYIPCNDFSFYDNMLDISVLLNAVPARYYAMNLSPIDTYFAMARGYQCKNCDVKALAMKKWFNTNYHYIVPEIEDNVQIKLNGTKPFDEFSEALELGIETKPALIGPFTFLKLACFTGTKRADDVADSVALAYCDVLKKFGDLGAGCIQLDEPSLVMDLSAEDKALFVSLYRRILSAKGGIKVFLQTFFGDIRDIYGEAVSLDFDGIGLDFIEGKKTLELIQTLGFPKEKILFAGLVNGKNIWKNNYEKTKATLDALSQHCGEIVLSTSCSLLHVPYSSRDEKELPAEYKKHFAFAEEKLDELAELKAFISGSDAESSAVIAANAALFAGNRAGIDTCVQALVSALSACDFERTPSFAEREQIQKTAFALPLLPTTTIGSFPQTKEVKATRAAFKSGALSEARYEAFNRKQIAECVALQESLGFDVLVHGEFERNDMVEYFGECLDGFLFTEKAWVQSYGTRCVKPPIIWGDISRQKPITVDWSVYAQSLTSKPVKGMLTGPMTILNWSFPREDIALKDCAFQIALAIREEALELEAHGIRIIQIDEAALREKLPLRKSNQRADYLDWAIPAFRLVHSGVKAETQIHTHMCYSEFGDIIRDIEDMDADVITFEAARADLSILEVLKKTGFSTQVGPGVYDIHAPRIPSVEEIKSVLFRMLGSIPKEKLWVNPDCGLKTRGAAETIPSLKHLVHAAKDVRNEI